MQRLSLRLGLYLAALTLAGGCELIVDPNSDGIDDAEDGSGGDGVDDDTDPSTDPCATVRCAEGFHCEAKQVQCIKEPCLPVAECVPNGDPTVGCEAVLCKEGTICIDGPKGAECVPPEENPCNLVDCQPELTCEVRKGEAVCVPAVGEPCGDATCGVGQVCCNPSCGICTAPDGACIQIACDDGGGATCAATLCAPDTVCVDTPEGAQCVPFEENPCNLIDCMDDSTCELRNGEAVCVPVGGGDACSDYECDVGQHCELLFPPCAPPPDGEAVPPDYCSPIPSCVDDEPSVGECAVTMCPPDTYCDDISGQAECIPLPSCSDVKCEKGSVCELVDVQCVRAPCPPQPQCVPAADDPCATVRCKAGTHCEAKEVWCVRAPCPPIAECVPDTGVACGPSTCDAGEVCCNESCGICTKPDGVCTQQYCGATD